MERVLRLIPHLKGYNRNDEPSLKTLWFMMDGSDTLAKQFPMCAEISIDSSLRRFRMFVMKPADVGGHFYDVVLDHRYHILVQMTSPELENIILTLKNSGLLSSEDTVTSCSALTSIDRVSPSFMKSIPAKNCLRVYSVHYYNTNSTCDWSVPEEDFEEFGKRRLEVYLHGENMSMLMLNF